jgi:hypothetical protein
MFPLAVAGAWLGSGCEAITEKVTQKVTESAIEHAIEKQVGGEVQIDEGGASFKGKDNEGRDITYDARSGKVPDNWPKDIPVYPNTKVKASLQGNGTRTLMMESEDSPDEVVAFYKSKLSSLEEEASVSSNGSWLLSFKDKPGKRTVMVTASRENEKTALNLAVNDEQP